MIKKVIEVRKRELIINKGGNKYRRQEKKNIKNKAGSRSGKIINLIKSLCFLKEKNVIIYRVTHTRLICKDDLKLLN